MSDKIHQLIDSIREQHSRVNEQLLLEQSKNEMFQGEIEKLKSQIENQLEEFSSLKNELDLAKNEQKEQIITSSKDTMISEEQIDELVKEIDYCIGQLKE